MRLIVPLRPNPEAPLARANPVAKLGAAAVLMVALFLSLDVLTPALAVLALLAVVPATGIGPRDLLARAWPLLLAAVALAVFNAIFAAEAGGATVLQLGQVSLRSEAVLSGVAVGLRVLGIALAGLLAMLATDPTDLADSLQQQLRFSPRLAVGALAAVRLMPTVAQEWQTLRLARRARGVSAGRSPVAAVEIVIGQLFSLLVSAIRRGTRLATAMEARGFGSRNCRTVARQHRMRATDWLLIAGAGGVAAIAIGLSLALGSWRFLFS
jgi:energy-coupling factor transport system permease protein